MTDTENSDMADTERSDIDAREQLTKEPGMRVRRTRRSPARLPAGTWEVLKEGSASADAAFGGCIPWSEVPPLTWEEQGGIAFAELELFRPLRYGIEHGAVREEDRRVLHDIIQLRFGCSLETALWLVPYLRELEFGRAERFELERSAADPNTVDLLALAQEVTLRTRFALAVSTTFRPLLPTYVSAELTALFLKKYSYTRGGGPLGSLSPDRIREILREPKDLAGYLRASPSRAKRFVRELSELDLLIETRRQGPKRQKAAQ